MIKNYYKTLGINQNASQIEIRKAFRKLANFWHPDKNSNSIAIEKMKDLALNADSAEKHKEKNR